MISTSDTDYSLARLLSYFWKTDNNVLLRSCYRSVYYYVLPGHWKGFFVVYIWADKSVFSPPLENSHINKSLQLWSQNKWAPCRHLNHAIYLVWVLNRVLYHKHSSITKLCRQSLTMLFLCRIFYLGKIFCLYSNLYLM